MPQAPFVQPPRIAAWSVDLFIPNQQAESIPGELLEEFSDLASKSGLAAGIGRRVRKRSSVSWAQDFAKRHG